MEVQMNRIWNNTKRFSHKDLSEVQTHKASSSCGNLSSRPTPFKERNYG